MAKKRKTKKKHGHKKASRKQLAALKKARAARKHGSSKTSLHKLTSGKYRLSGTLVKV